MKIAMKTAVAMAILAGSISVANAAGNGDGEVKFIGSIHEGACSISPETANQTVDLGPIAKNQLAAGGRTNGEPFQIDLEGCDVAALTDKTVTATFTGTEDSTIPGSLALTGVASGAGIFMEHGGKVVELGTPTEPQLLQDGRNTLAFNAFVKGHATTAVVPGAFEAITNFTLAYQ
ncbi:MULTISPECIES: fimbrial protein [Pseudomonas fluorescens group]|uniref:MrpA_2 protein n=1 Tax=Pseudomonas fluorescens TaxID=294 RepID=A0A0D0TKD8_PSEFL|nr:MULTISPECIES: fimbrial protein [Pseudomonas fluorescens group]AZE62715.1 P pilus assembly protein, pilin FimA [Pseudomonas synxantha]KIR23636.1 Major MR/P fimbria protein precursor [Pseudomonas fluorescens]